MSVLLVVKTPDLATIGYVLDLHDTRRILTGRFRAFEVSEMLVAARGGMSPDRRIGMDLLIADVHRLDPMQRVIVERVDAQAGAW